MLRSTKHPRGSRCSIGSEQRAGGKRPRRLDRAKLVAANDGLPLHEAFHRGGAEVGTGEFVQFETTGPGSTPRPKLTIHGNSILSLALATFQRANWKEETVAEQQYDGLDHEERGSGHRGSTLAASCSTRSASTSTRKAHNWDKQAPTHCCRRLTNRHNCDQEKQAHIAELAENMNQANEFHDSRTVWQRARDIPGTALGPRGWFQCSSRRVSIDSGRLGPLHGHNFLKRKKSTPRKLSWRHQDHRLHRFA